MGKIVSSVTDAVGLTDSGAAEKAMGKAAGLSRAQMARLDAIDLPDEEKMRLLLESPELVGLLEAEQLDDTAMGEISLDPQMRDKQMQALSALQERADQGITDTDKYAMEQMLGDVASQEQSRQRQIESQMAQQGMDSSGAALAAKLQGKQSSANNARQQAMQMAAQGQQNRQQALQALGQQAGQMESADYGRQANLASARDTISKYNAQNSQNVNAQNLAARQSIANQRVNTANQQQTYNKGLEQQQFQNKLQKAGAQGVAGGNLANMYQNQASAQAGADANTMGILGSLGAAAISDERVKTDIVQGDKPIEEMLDNIRPYEYNYSDEVISEPSMEGRQLGVMAQDLEQSPLGQEFVEEENGMKKVNYGKMGSTQMAALGNLHDRLKTLEETLMKKYPENSAADGAVINSLVDPSELPQRGGTDFASPDDRQSAMYAALMQELQGQMNPQEIPMQDELPAYECGGVHKKKKYMDGGTPIYASDGMGDIIDSGMESYADDRVDAKVNDGEAILNVPQQQRMMDLLRGKISLTELGDDDIVEGVPKDYRDDLHEKIEDESEGKDVKMAGLEKLIQLLGK